LALADELCDLAEALLLLFWGCLLSLPYGLIVS